MNGKQAKSLRHALGLKKPTFATASGIFMDGEVMKFRRRENPEMNTYRKFKRMYIRGEMPNVRAPNRHTGRVR